MKRRRPPTMSGYVGLGALRGALAGTLSGVGLAELVLVTEDAPFDARDLAAIGSIGAIIGVIVGIVGRTVIGAIVGVLRDRLGPVAPAVAAITFGAGTIIAIGVAISNIGTGPRHVAYGLLLSLGISVPIAAIAGLAAAGIDGHAARPTDASRSERAASS